ncbi:hypothetical protein BDV97DRAFT_366917 [Delphinella strobiligena]|nr:hypothetical protein BDV97DRAFT_366917 [Delphinella strobiligena]
MSQELEILPRNSDEKHFLETITFSEVGVTTPPQNCDWQSNASPEPSSVVTVQYPVGIAHFELESNERPILRLPAFLSRGKACNRSVSGKANCDPGPDAMDSLRQMPIDNFSIFCLALYTAHHGCILNFPGLFPVPIMVKVEEKPSESRKKWKPMAVIGRIKLRLKN